MNQLDSNLNKTINTAVKLLTRKCQVPNDKNKRQLVFSIHINVYDRALNIKKCKRTLKNTTNTIFNPNK